MTVRPGGGGDAGQALAVAGAQLVSAILVGRHRDREAQLLERYAAHLRGTSLVLSFATVCELRHGGLKAGWAPARTGRMETWLREVAAIVMPDNDLVTACAGLRACGTPAAGTAMPLATRFMTATGGSPPRPYVTRSR